MTNAAIAGAHINAPGFGYFVRRPGTYAFEPAFYPARRTEFLIGDPRSEQA
jgi:hypothetical protein